MLAIALAVAALATAGCGSTAAARRLSRTSGTCRVAESGPAWPKSVTVTGGVATTEGGFASPVVAIEPGGTIATLGTYRRVIAHFDGHRVTIDRGFFGQQVSEPVRGGEVVMPAFFAPRMYVGSASCTSEDVALGSVAVIQLTETADVKSRQRLVRPAFGSAISMR